MFFAPSLPSFCMCSRGFAARLKLYPTRIGMPQHCKGFFDPKAGVEPRPCLFAADGNGGPARVAKQRDGMRCAFCSPAGVDKAMKSKAGRGNLTCRLKRWKELGSPVYEAAFIFGMVGLLSDLQQLQFRRRAGEALNFNRRTSWAHKKAARLIVLTKGKPIPAAPKEYRKRRFGFLSQASPSGGQAAFAWAKLRNLAAAYAHHRESAEKVEQGKEERREFWKLRRSMQQLLLPFASSGAPFGQAVAWAMEEGFLSTFLIEMYQAGEAAEASRKASSSRRKCQRVESKKQIKQKKAASSSSKETLSSGSESSTPTSRSRRRDKGRRLQRQHRKKRG